MEKNAQVRLPVASRAMKPGEVTQGLHEAQRLGAEMGLWNEEEPANEAEKEQPRKKTKIATSQMLVKMCGKKEKRPWCSIGGR